MKLQTLHRALATICALQLLLWIGSGLALSLISENYLDPDGFRTKDSSAPITTAKAITSDAMPPQVVEIKLDTLLSRPVYRIKLVSGNLSLWGDTLEPIRFNDALLSQIAAASVTAPLTGEIEHVPGSQIGFPEIKRVSMFNAQTKRNTRVLLDAASGAILAHKDQGSDLKELLLMLHFMDYNPGNGIGFNALPIRLFALLTLMMVLSGSVVLYRKWRAGFFRKAKSLANLIVEDCQGAELGRFACSASMLEAINAKTARLTTGCGGGGSCGMCAVKFIDSAPKPTAADIDKLGERVNLGIRLACQHGYYSGRVQLVNQIQERFWQKEASKNPA